MECNGAQSCWSQLKQATNGGGCNAWVWCGQPAGCNNGFGTVYPYQQCTLKFQASLQAAKPSLNTTSKYGISEFTSGWIRKFHDFLIAGCLEPLLINLNVCIIIASCSPPELALALPSFADLVEAIHIKGTPSGCGLGC